MRAPGAVIPGEKPDPPESLTDEEAVIWRRVVAVLPDGWFGPECHDLLARYCEVMARAEVLAHVLRKVGKGKSFTLQDRALLMQQRSDLRAANMLATSLRLTPKSRVPSRKAHSAMTALVRRPTRDTTSQVRPWEINASNGSDEDDTEEDAVE
jgi:hypothetical protein